MRTYLPIFPVYSTVASFTHVHLSCTFLYPLFEYYVRTTKPAINRYHTFPKFSPPLAWCLYLLNDSCILHISYFIYTCIASTLSYQLIIQKCCRHVNWFASPGELPSYIFVGILTKIILPLINQDSFFLNQSYYLISSPLKQFIANLIVQQ